MSEGAKPTQSPVDNEQVYYVYAIFVASLDLGINNLVFLFYIHL